MSAQVFGILFSCLISGNTNSFETSSLSWRAALTPSVNWYITPTEQRFNPDWLKQQKQERNPAAPAEHCLWVQAPQEMMDVRIYCKITNHFPLTFSPLKVYKVSVQSFFFSRNVVTPCYVDNISITAASFQGIEQSLSIAIIYSSQLTVHASSSSRSLAYKKYTCWVMLGPKDVKQIIVSSTLQKMTDKNSKCQGIHLTAFCAGSKLIWHIVEKSRESRKLLG